MWKLRWHSHLSRPLILINHLEACSGKACKGNYVIKAEEYSRIPNVSYSRWHKNREQNDKLQTVDYSTITSSFNINQRNIRRLSVLSTNIYHRSIENGLIYKTSLHTSVKSLHKKFPDKIDLIENEDITEDTFGNLAKTKKTRKELSKEKKLQASQQILESKAENEALSQSNIKENIGDLELSSIDADRISKLFPQPKNTLDCYQSMLGKKIFDVIHKQITPKHKGKNKLNPKAFSWTTTIKILSPEKIHFEGNAFTKSAALEKATYKTLHWLYSSGRINHLGKPIHSEEDIKELKKDMNQPLLIDYNSNFNEQITKLIDRFVNDIEPLLSKEIENTQTSHKILPSGLTISENEDEDFDVSESSKVIHDYQSAMKEEYVDRIFGIAPEDKNPAQMQKRSEYLLRRLQDRPEEIKLPITEHKRDVIDSVRTNRVLVIQGAPGCGKSTCVPNYILDHWTERELGAECGILVSQPRRVAAVSLAQRVAEQRGEKVGNTVGHQVRLSTKLTKDPGGGIVYCTAGALLRRLAVSPDLPGCTHLILDEAHERSIDIDAVMTLSKRCLDLNRNLRVIVMSATIDTELFSNYYQNCPVIEIPGFMYPVKSTFLDDLPKDISRNLPKAWRTSTSDNEDYRPILDPHEVVQLIKWVHKNRSDGAILVFLPGWGEIKRVRDLLYDDYDKRTYAVFPIHSKLSIEDQHQIFSKSGEGVRKIILATNIAETSITIDDVSYVIDTGLHKEIKLMNSRGISSLDTNWVSRANVKQRRGRAGRVKPGECFHMYTKEKLETFEENPVPEILRVPLEKTVLDCKTYTEDESVIDFLQRFPQPPSIEATEMAIKYLTDLGALDQSENLTALGRKIVSFTSHPKLSKALIHSTIFKVATPILDLTTILTNNTDLFVTTSENKEAIRNFKRKYHPNSDHLAMFWLNQHFKDLRQNENFDNVDDFCRSHHLRKERMDGVRYLREIYVGHLQNCNMLPSDNYEKGQTFDRLDDFSNNDEMVKGVLYSGLNSLLCLRNFIRTTGKLAKVKTLSTDFGQKGFISSDSVNYNIDKTLSSGALMYCGAIHSEERRGILVKDTSLLNPLTIFLFSSKMKQAYVDEEKVIFEIPEKKIRLQTSYEDAQHLVDFRNIIWSLVNYYIENNNLNESLDFGSFRDDYEAHNKISQDEEKNQKIDDFRNEVLTCLAKVLTNKETHINSEPTVIENSS